MRAVTDAFAQLEVVAAVVGETPEHYTPKAVIDLVVACLDAIDLDPCSNPGAPNVPAAQHYTEADDGLAHPWRVVST